MQISAKPSRNGIHLVRVPFVWPEIAGQRNGPELAGIMAMWLI
jgi:hypothetical protein